MSQTVRIFVHCGKDQVEDKGEMLFPSNAIAPGRHVFLPNIGGIPVYKVVHTLAMPGWHRVLAAIVSEQYTLEFSYPDTPEQQRRQDQELLDLLFQVSNILAEELKQKLEAGDG